MAGGERIFATLGLAPDTVRDGTGPAARERERAPIDLRRVVFGYGGDRPGLRGTSLSVGAGWHVALVGRTGAGKTSALHLLAGLYAPWSGTVRVAGVDPRT